MSRTLPGVFGLSLSFCNPALKRSAGTALPRDRVFCRTTARESAMLATRMIDWSLLYLVSEWAIRLVMLIYVPQRRSAAASRTWLLFIFLLPWPGVVLYWLFGRIYIPARRVRMQIRASRFIREAQAQIGARTTAEPDLPAALQFIPGLARRLGDFETLAGNRLELLPDYDATIDRIIGDIDAAQQHVHLLFYIFLADQTGKRVAEALVRASMRGVNCRVLMDAVGSRQGLERLAPRMRSKGVEVLAMLPVGLFRRNAARFDLRNHRKIVVIDGRVGYTGSQNIVNSEFVNGYPNEELMVRVTGPVVAQLQAMFLADHYFETGNVFEPGRTLPKFGERREFAGPIGTEWTGVRARERTGTDHCDALRGTGTDRHHNSLFRSGRTVFACGMRCETTPWRRSTPGAVNAREPGDHTIRSTVLLR